VENGQKAVREEVELLSLPAPDRKSSAAGFRQLLPHYRSRGAGLCVPETGAEPQP